MRLARIRIQWLMVWVLVAGILSWGVPSFISETKRRWNNCRNRAADHAKQAKQHAAWANFITKPSPGYTRYKDPSEVHAAYKRNKDLSDFHAGKSKEYNRAMYRPWVIWSLGE
jgi:hypothetical protein